ncbi:MAG: type VI secretion system baseplate subunit TssF [Polyangiales bacterium]
MFSKYYQDELAYLRELGREFAQAYPQLAPMLADRGGDPDVERLLEGTAFLTARVREKLDDELPEAIHAIAELIFPQLVRSIPSAAILELTPTATVLRGKHVVAAGTEFGSVPVDKTRCVFRSTTDCELTPWVIDDARLELLPGGGQQLRIEMRIPLGLPVGEIAPQKLRLHFPGETRQTLALLMQIYERTTDVVLIESVSTGAREREVSLGKRALSLVGFEPHEALLPYPRGSFPGFRLLAEYYALPAKFAFLDVASVGRVGELDKEIKKFAIAFRFANSLPSSTRVTKESVKLHCVPVVNLFSTTAEPIRLSATREQYAVRVAGLPPSHGEVYSIEKVEAVSRGTSRRLTIPRFYDFAHLGLSREGQFFYTTHVVPSVVSEGADLAISIGTPEDASHTPDADVLSIDLVATNRQLASALRAGEINVPTPSSPAICTFKNLQAVTRWVPPPLGRDLQWRAIAHSVMGLRSLAETEVLRAALDVYNLHATVDRQAARANELRLAALKNVKVSADERLYRGASIRGVAIDLELDESGFDGDGDLFLFGAIIDRFFGDYVSVNSFSRTTVHGLQTKLRIQWPPRSGSLTLL